MIELAILGLLKEGSMHGYELKKRLGEVLPPRSSISFGSLYPALGRLERDGSVAAAATSTSVVASTMPMTGSFTGEAAAFRASSRTVVRGPRNKKVYDLTPAGDERLAQLIADPAEDERSFGVKVAFCRFTDASTRARLLLRRRATLVERLAEGRRTIAARGAGLDLYLRSLLEHESETTERDIAWIDRLLADEQALTEASRPADHGDDTDHHATPTAPTLHAPPLRDGHEPAPTAHGGTR